MAYGLSEVAGRVAFNYPKPRTNSVGHLHNGVNVKIIDKNGNRCGIAEDGEILIRTPYPFLGYYNDAKKYAAAVDSEGWLYSGDIGHFDADGYLFIVDRLKDMLYYGDFWVSPFEIEQVILKHRGVISTCVVGIPDLKWTELIAAVVVKNNDYDVTEFDIEDGVKSTTNLIGNS